MKKIYKIIILITITTLLSLNIIYANENDETNKLEVEFLNAVDGDTAKFELNGEKITVRFLAIDTPESVHPTKSVEAYGIEASNYTKEKLQNADLIQLEYDNNSDEKDKYNRHLAWIWVDGQLLQELLIKEGLAKVAYLYGDYKYTALLKTQQQEAQEKNINIWSDEEVTNQMSNENTSIDEETKEEQINENNKEFNYVYAIAVGTCVILYATGKISKKTLKKITKLK